MNSIKKGQTLYIGEHQDYDLVPKHGAPPVPAGTELTVTYVPDNGENSDRIWRRMDMCFDGPEKAELYALLDRLHLSRRELALIVLGLRVQPGFSLKDFGA